MKQLQYFICLLIFIIPILLNGQKYYEAERLIEEITLDGILDEKCWSDNAATGFVQLEPNLNDSPSEKTEVYIRYNDKAIYVGAKLWDSEPNKILTELANRDQNSNTDLFAVFFDTYKDGINAFAFGVTAAGVQKDVKFSTQGEDSSWDAVWDSRVTSDQHGWYVEMEIPYNAIRFAEKEEQVWGFQITREIRRYREENFWNPIDPNKDGFVNQFGVLSGLKDLKTPIRINVMPYLSAYYDSRFNPKVAGSFNSSGAYAAGLDLKLGLSDAFTLDMTLIPDFGQTISDNQVLNLSPFEVFFEENRPFFTEGLELFNRGRLFYTRRVGGRPINFFKPYFELQEGETVVENPSNTSLINATKISGRTKGKTGIGLFNGITAREFATIKSSEGIERRVETSPLTNYNVAVVDQTLRNNSYVTLMNTNVWRRGDTYDANTTGVFTAFNDKNQKFGARLNGVMTHQYDPEESTSGYSAYGEIGKYSGKWTYSTYYGLETDTYNPNDLGFLFSNNEQFTGLDLSYQEFSPKYDKLNLYRVNTGLNYNKLYSPNEFTEFSWFFNNFWLFKSRDAIGYFLFWQPYGQRNYFEPRRSSFDRYLPVPANWTFDAFYSSDYRRVFAADIGVSARIFPSKDRREINFRVDPRIRFNDKFSLFFQSRYNFSFGDQGFVDRFIDDDIGDLLSLPEDYVMIGNRDRQIITNTLSLKYIFTNRMGLNLRVRHYWDKVTYDAYYALGQSGKLLLQNLVNQGEVSQNLFNRNVNFFNIDLQYQWRYAPGSDLFIVWKNQISNSDDAFEVDYFTNFKNLFGNLQSNSISIRAVYFLDYNNVFG